MGSRSHGSCVVSDGGVGAGVSMIVMLWILVLVIAYYMRWDYYIVSTVYIHFFTCFYTFFLHVSTISGVSLRFLEFRGIFGVPTCLLIMVTPTAIAIPGVVILPLLRWEFVY